MTVFDLGSRVGVRGWGDRGRVSVLVEARVRFSVGEWVSGRARGHGKGPREHSDEARVRKWWSVGGFLFGARLRYESQI